MLTYFLKWFYLPVNSPVVKLNRDISNLYFASADTNHNQTVDLFHNNINLHLYNLISQYDDHVKKSMYLDDYVYVVNSKLY